MLILYIYALSYSTYFLSALFKFNMNEILRIPLLNIRYIDFSLLIIFFIFVKDLLNKQFSRGKKKLSFFQILILFYLIFELWNLYRSFGEFGNDFFSSFALFLSSLSIVSMFMLSESSIEANDLKFLINFIVFAGIVLSIDGISKFLGLSFGFSYAAEGGRVMFETTGFKNNILNSALFNLVLPFSIMYKNFDLNKKKRIILIISLLILAIAVVLAFARGDLYVWIFTIIFAVLQGETKSKFKNILVILFVGILLFTILSDYLNVLGYNPFTKLNETFEYSIDVNNPAWDKGRAVAQARALQKWKEDIFFGKGYVSYYYTNNISPHNFFITSLLIRGLIGTILLTIILIIAYSKSILLWRRIKYIGNKDKSFIKTLIFSSWLWLIPLMTQESFTERYSVSAQFIYLGIICGLNNFYSQKRDKLN